LQTVCTHVAAYLKLSNR